MLTEAEESPWKINKKKKRLKGPSTTRKPLCIPGGNSAPRGLALTPTVDNIIRLQSFPGRIIENWNKLHAGMMEINTVCPQK